MERVIEAAKRPRDRALIRLLAETGIRRAEAAALRVEDIGWEENLLVIQSGKGRKRRLVPVTGNLLAELRGLIRQRSGGPVFVSARGGSLCPRQINRIVSEAARKAGIKNPNPKYAQVTPHLFRHSFARLWKDRKGSIEALSKIMGHESVRTTWDLYGTLGLNDIKREYHRIITPSLNETSKINRAAPKEKQ